MILSASRRTDIPAFFSEWFFNRIKAGDVMVRNPQFVHQISHFKITPDVVDCIVFWTKNPKPMLSRLDELKWYDYYFQYTVNAYPSDVEPRVPPLEERLETFRTLSDRIGKERVIWRYDPIFFSDTFTAGYHLGQIEAIAQKLEGKTEKCVFSLVDIYPTKNAANMRALGCKNLSKDEFEDFIGRFRDIGQKYDLRLATCAELVDLSKYGIEHNHCIDGELIQRITGYMLKTKEDGQRDYCGCVKCEEIGAYDTCPHGCVYCYANFRKQLCSEKLKLYDPNSPLLCDRVDPEVDKVNERDVKSIKNGRVPPAFFDQTSFF